ncbi:hypothetical protein CLS_29230 [[Clostridium] cf. saccharolyticum K10]|nr:hypothetical protein CLS_29230 [[Clostridium] cf. saccharolyticum K10]
MDTGKAPAFPGTRFLQISLIKEFRKQLHFNLRLLCTGRGAFYIPPLP